MNALGFWLAMLVAIPSADPPKLPDDVFAPAPVSDSLPTDVFAILPSDDVLDVAVFGKTQVAVVRFHIRNKGKGYHAAWSESLIRLYGYLDRNNDGILSTAEAGCAPWTRIIQGPFNEGGTIVKAGTFDPNHDGKVSFDEFTHYVTTSWDYAPIASRPGPAPDGRTEAVFALLDHNKDKCISISEYITTDSRLVALDIDENELLDANEVLGESLRDETPYPRMNNAQPSQAPPGAVALTSDEVRAAVALRIVTSLGKGSVRPILRKVGPEVFHGEGPAFDAADLDKDGLLGLDELRTRYLTNPAPSLEISINLGDAKKSLEKRESASLSGTMTARKNEAGRLTAEFDETEIEVESAEATPVSTDQYLQQFKTADTDKNGVIDFKESRADNLMGQIFLIADRDANFKLTEPELQAYLERTRDANENRMALSINDLGADLFKKLDANRDDQLSIRELRTARQKLRTLDRNHDGVLALEEFPKGFNLGVTRGFAQIEGQITAPTIVANAAPLVPEPKTIIPAWFSGMDRNGDGDVSAREFVGPIAVFRRLDLDGDGLIDTTEAAKAANLTATHAR